MGVDSTCIAQACESSGAAGGQNTGLDRFGDVVDQRRLPRDIPDQPMSHLLDSAPVLPPTPVRPPVASARCVVLVPSARIIDPACEAAIAELGSRRYPVWRPRTSMPPAEARDRMAADALAAGFEELLWVDPAVAFEPDDADRLRGRGLPVVGAVCPVPGRRAMACEFPPGTTSVRFGRSGGPIEVVSLALGFAVTRRAVFEAIRDRHLAAGGKPGEAVPFFAPPPGRDPAADPDGGTWFCQRARECGFRVMADTAVRVWVVGPYRYGWEDAGQDPPRFDDYVMHLGEGARPPGGEPPPVLAPHPAPRPAPPRGRLRGEARALPPGPPKIKAYIVTYPANRDSLTATLGSYAASDWGEDPVVIDQPPDWPPGGPSAPANYKRALEAAVADGCDFALVSEDDVRVTRHLRHNLLALPLIRRDQCDYLSLYLPDLIADPWERAEPHLGYRLAKPRIVGPNRLWEKHRLWGVQGIVYSRRLLQATLARWDQLSGVQDTRLLAVCQELALPLYYSAPSWVDHAPVRSGYGTPFAYAADFDPAYRLEVGDGFQPPEAVPGWLTRDEGKLLWEVATGRDVLEIGAGAGRATVCLAQSARRVAAVDPTDPPEAGEWVMRFGLADRVEFRSWAGLDGLAKGFGVGVVSARDAAGLTRDLDAALRLVAPGGLLAIQNYPDPAWPDVRKVVDEYAKRQGWKRVSQADYLGVFQT
jgi:hypothetical protein